MNSWSLIVVPLSIVLIALGLGACGGESVVIEGQLPQFQVGDTFRFDLAIEGTDYEDEFKVTGEEISEGKDAYVYGVVFDPPVGGLLRDLEGSIDKATIDTIKIQSTTEVLGIFVIITTRYSYEYDGPRLYPLSVGKQVNVIETKETIRTSLGDTETASESNTFTYEIEAIEDVTVPAGTFRSFKVVKYDESGSKVDTAWHADAVRSFDIKTLDHETGETSELTSYTLADDS